MMTHKITTYLLDGASFSTLIAGISTGHQIAIFLGGCASVMAFINHWDQYRTRKKDKK